MKYKKPKYKRKKVRIQKIKPLRKHCDCGRPVLNHHYLCDFCYSKRMKRKYWTQTKNNSNKFYETLRMKKNENGGIIVEKVEVGV